MKATNLEFSIVDNYLSLLKNLSHDNKLELISKLSESLKNSEQSKEKEKSLDDLYGAFISDQSPEEMIAEIKKSRTFKRKIEEL